MKKLCLLLVLLLAFVFAGCDSQDADESAAEEGSVEETPSEGNGMEVMPVPPAPDEQVGTVTMDYAGGQYSGEVQGALPHGIGEFSVGGMVIYQGEFKNGLFDGEGVLFRENGSKAYEGVFKDGEPHGFGVEYDEAGNVISEGQWERGMPAN